LKIGIDKASSASQKSYSRTHPDVIKAVVLGRTGSGKTTLLYSFAGKTLHGVPGSCERTNLDVTCSGDQMFDEDGNKIEIGHGVDSQTFYPNRFLSDDKTIEFFDNPGLVDTNPDKRLINAFSMDQVLSYPGRVAILIVISENDFGEKADAAFNAFDTITEMFPNEAQLKESVALIITKTKMKEPEMVLEELKKSKDRHNYLVNYLWEQKDERVFCFPAPDGCTEHCFKDKNRVIEFIRNHSVNNPDHKIALDPPTALSINKLLRPFEQRRDLTIRKVVALFKSVCENVKDVNELRTWEGYSKSLTNAANESYDNFVQKCKELGDSIPDFQTISQELFNLTQWDNFIFQTLSKTDAEKYLKNGRNRIMKIIEDSLKSYGKMIENNANQIEAFDNLKKKTDELNEKYKQGQISLQECQEKTKQLEEDMENREKEYKEQAKQSQQAINDLQAELQRTTEEHNKKVQELTEANNKQLQDLAKDYDEKIKKLQKDYEDAKRRADENWKKEVTLELIKTFGPAIADNIRYRIESGRSSSKTSDDHSNMPDVNPTVDDPLSMDDDCSEHDDDDSNNPAFDDMQYDDIQIPDFTQ